MSITLGFDVYGTLIDTAGTSEALAQHVGESAAAFASLWRSKQLEYAFRRALMNKYRDFAVCTRQALDYVCLYFQTPIAEADRKKLMEEYLHLPAFPDAKRGLARMKAAGFRLFAFSMGRRDDVSVLIERAQLDDYFAGLVSLEDVKCYKPSPIAYAHFLETTGTAPADAWLVSGNPFDVLGAVSAGICGAWVKRSPDAILDPWEIAPTVIAEDLPALCDILVARVSSPAPSRKSRS